MSLKNVQPINFQFQFINKEMILHLFEFTNASHKSFWCIILALWIHSSQDGARMAAVLRAPGKLCSFSYVLFVFLLFYVLDVVSND